MSLFPLALGHIDKKLFVMSLFPLTPGHIVEKSLVMSPSPSAPGHIDKNHLRCPISTVLWDIQNNFFYICPNYIKEGHNQELFLYMSFNHSPLPLILPDRQLSYHFLKPFRTLPDILLRNSIIPVHLPEIRPISAHHPRRAGCGATETFICFFY